MYASSNVIGVIKLRIMRWAMHISHMVEIKMHTVLLLENQKGRDHSEDLGVDRKVILEWILMKQGGKLWTGFIRLRIGTSGGLL
jgi:hypothetical protein